MFDVTINWTKYRLHFTLRMRFLLYNPANYKDQGHAIFSNLLPWLLCQESAAIILLR